MFHFRYIYTNRHIIVVPFDYILHYGEVRDAIRVVVDYREKTTFFEGVVYVYRVYSVASPMSF